MEIYARDWIKNKKYVTELQLQTLIAHWFKFYPFPPPYPHRPMLVSCTVFFWPENNVDSYVFDVVLQSQHWQVGEGEGRKYSDIFNVNFCFSCRTIMF